MDSLTIDFFLSTDGLTDDQLDTLPIYNSTPKDKTKERRRKSTTTFGNEFYTKINSYLTKETCKSILKNGGGFIIKPIKLLGGSSIQDIAGYRVNINLPSSTIGNNLLLENRVWSGCKIALLFLKNWLLVNECHRDVVNVFNVNDSSIIEVTPTFLVPFASNEEANAANVELYHHADTIFNLKIRAKKIASYPVFWIGNPRQGTLYYKHKKFQIKSYVKNGTVTKAHSVFENDDVKKMLYAEAGCMLRIEITLSFSWLLSNNLVLPESWMSKYRNNPYHKAFQLIKKTFRCDDELRRREPRSFDMKSLNDKDKLIVLHHLKGGVARTYKEVMNKTEPNKYYCGVKKRIYKALRIDCSIPWKAQKENVSPNIKRILNVTGPYRAPEALENFIFCRKTIPRFIRELKAANKRLSSNQKNSASSISNSGNSTLERHDRVICGLIDDTDEPIDLSDLMSG